jgi:hypothetical protein
MSVEPRINARYYFPLEIDPSPETDYIFFSPSGSQYTACTRRLSVSGLIFGTATTISLIARSSLHFELSVKVALIRLAKLKL